MNKTTDLWTIVRLEAEHSKISFPEYQREPTVGAERDLHR